jgi:hypothetical protein
MDESPFYGSITHSGTQMCVMVHAWLHSCMVKVLYKNGQRYERFQPLVIEMLSVLSFLKSKVIAKRLV